MNPEQLSDSVKLHHTDKPSPLFSAHIRSFSIAFRGLLTPKLTLRKGAILSIILLTLLFARLIVTSKAGLACPQPIYHYNVSPLNSTPALPFAPPENAPNRLPDITDTFASYKHRSHPSCNISSLDLHLPFSPLCTSRPSLVSAFTNGGRIGKDAPFMPRGCDMRWFSSQEVCEILGRFEKVIVVGDSMMRHVVGAVNVLVREDLGYGAVTDWNFTPQEKKDCFCNHQFDVKTCSVQGIYKTKDVEVNDPESLSCGLGKIDLIIEVMLRHPHDSTELSRLASLLPASGPANTKPYAFLLGHGLWNDLDLARTIAWLTDLLSTITATAPHLAPGSGPTRDGRAAPGYLFLTPNAAGSKKPDMFLVNQGNKALQGFEEAVKEEVAERWAGAIEVMGTWNMSIQASKYDGVHLDLKGNLVKAMGVLNWLAML